MNNPGDLFANSYPICVANSIAVNSKFEIAPFDYAVSSTGFHTSIYIVISSVRDSRLKDMYQYVITKDKIYWMLHE